jgi:hypothetical protein
MRIAALILAGLAATGCMSRSTSGGDEAGTTALEISISVKGSERPTKVWTLRCPDTGTLPDAARACMKLDRLDRPFAPVPKQKACTAIYGGPQVAAVTGTFKGQPVDARFARGDGCEIARWNRLAFLFPST